MKEVTYTPTFIEFWLSTNRKGSKERAFTAFKNKMKSHGLEKIKSAFNQLNHEKRSHEFQFWPDIATFLNSQFEGYFDRVPKSIKMAKRQNHPYYVSAAAQKLNKSPESLPYHGKYLSAEDRLKLNIPPREYALSSLADIKKIMSSQMTLGQFYEKWEVPMEYRIPELREAAF